MAWTTPPTFTDGNVLSAAQLNILSADIEHLWERAQQTNVATERMSISAGDGVGGEKRMTIVHKFETLEYSIPMEVGTFDDLTIKYDATTVFSDGTDRSNPYVYTGTIDLTSFAFAVGQVYTITVNVGGEPGSANNSAVINTMQEVP